MYKPWTERKFGVEMEIRTTNTVGQHVDATQVARGLRNLGLRVGSSVGNYYHSSGSTWDVKSDSSCGWEIATPALVMDAEGHNEELRKGTTYLRTEVRAKVDSSCGLHVHVDCSDFTWDQLRDLMILWSRYEPFFFECTPPSRHRNSYCSPLNRAFWTDQPGERNGNWRGIQNGFRATTEREFRSHIGSARGALNYSGWWSHGRVEFRLGAGTVDYEKVRMWVTLLLSLVGRVAHSGPGRRFPRISNVTNWTTALGLDTRYVLKSLGVHRSVQPETEPLFEALAVWVDARRRRFAPTPPRRSGERVTPPGSTARTGAEYHEAVQEVIDAARRASRTAWRVRSPG